MAVNRPFRALADPTRRRLLRLLRQRRRTSGELADAFQSSWPTISRHLGVLTQTVPAGGVSSTAADMGRLMLALLGDGPVDGERILTQASVNAMLAPQFTPDPHIPARAYEMTHRVAHGRHLLHKDGTLGDQVA